MSDDLSPDPHGYFDLLKAAEQLSKNDESSQKLAERLLKEATDLPCAFRALCHMILTRRCGTRAVWHAGMAVCVFQMEVLSRELDSADVSAVVERLKSARDKLTEVRLRETESGEEASEQEQDKDDAGVQSDIEDHDTTDPAVLAHRFQTMSTQLAQLAKDMAALESDLEDFNGPMYD